MNQVVEHLLESQPPSSSQLSIEEEIRLRALRTRIYERARKYWQETGNSERLALTDDELDEQFWLFDRDGIPRLKSERGTVELPNDPFILMAEMAETEGWSSGRSDISENFDEILGQIVEEQLQQRRQAGNGDR